MGSGIDLSPPEGGLDGLIKSKDWSETPLGKADTWPEALRTAVGICLGSSFATCVCWGPELIQIYNDAATRILCSKHPDGLGRPFREAWSEIWPDIGPLLERVLRTGEPGAGGDMPLLLDRGGPREMGFFTFSLCPIWDLEGRPGGIFVTAIETTAKARAELAMAISAERLRASDARHAFLLNLGDRLRPLKDPIAIQWEASRLLGEQLGLHRVLYVEIDQQANLATVHRDWNSPQGSSIAGSFALDSFGPALVSELARGETVRVDDTVADARTKEHGAAYQAADFRAVLAVPLLKGGVLSSLLAAHGAAARAWTDFEAALVEETAQRTWEAVERERAEALLRDGEARQAFLLALNDRLGEMADAEEMTAAAAELLGRHLDANRVVYGEMEPDGLHMSIWSDWTDGTIPSAKGRYRVDAFDAELMDGYRRGRVRRTDDTHAEKGGITAGDKALGIRAAVGVPMLKGGRLAAGMSVHSVRPRHWTDSEVHLVREVGERIWSSVERTRAEAALRVREEKYRTLFESMDEGFCVLEVLVDESGAAVDALHIEANPAYAKHTGLSDVVGKKWSELVTSLAPNWLQYYVQVLQTGEPLRFENHSPTLDRWFDLRVVRVGSAGQNRIAVLLRDVTARRHADDEFRRVAERDAFLVTLADALGPLAEPLEIQEAATRTLGGHLGASRVHYAEVSGDEALIRRDYTANGVPSVAGLHRLSEFRGFAYSEVMAGRTFVCDDVASDERIGAEERASVTERFGARARVSVPLLKGGVLRALSSVQFEAPHAWAPGEIELIRETAERTWAALERARAEAAQRESEERIRAIVQNVHDYAIVLTDARGIITEWPDGAERLIGYTEEEALGQSISIFYTPEDIAVGEHERELDEAAVEGRAERERWRVRKGGERIWTNEIATAVRDSAGNLLGFTRIARDLTERKRAEETRLAAAEADAFRVQLSDALRTVSDPIEVSGVVATVLGQHLGAMRVLYTEIHGDKSIVHRDYTDGAPSAAGVHDLPVYERFLGRRSRMGVTTVIHDVEHDEGIPPKERGALKGHGIGAIMSVPLVKAGELRATFDVHYAEPHIWTTAEVLRVEETAERGWAAVERARAEEALAKAHAELEERVAQRTAELGQMNRALAEEVSQRRRAEQMRSDLLRRLDSAQEDERRRVARDLHDQVGQTLTALTLAVRATRDAGPLPPAVSARLAEVQRAAEELGREVHGLAVRLRPTALDDLGLHAALGQLLSDWSTRTSIELDCQLADLEAVRFPPEFETVLYRVVQEALTNVARHSRAERASVVVQRVNGTVIAAVEDDGVGFEMNAVSAGRIGLLGLSERVTLVGGTLDIESVKGQGTTVLARIPC